MKKATLHWMEHGPLPVWLWPWCLYLAIMPFEAFLNGLGLQLAILGLGLVSALLLALAPVKHAPLANWRLISVITLMVAIAISGVASLDQSQSLRMTVRIGCYAVMYVLAASVCLGPRRFDAVLRASLWGGAAAGTMVVVLASRGIMGSDGRPTLTWRGAEADPNFFASALLVPFAAGLYLTGQAIVRRQAWAVPLAALPTLAVGAGILTTQSRGGMLALAVTMLAYQAFRGRWKTLVAAALVMGMTYMLMAPSLGRLDLSQDESGSFRTQIWSAVLESFPERWLTGLGLGAAPTVTESARGLYWAREPHSTYVEAVGETGIPGTLALFAVLATHLALRRRLRSAPAFAGVAGLCMAAVFLHFLPYQVFWAGLILAGQAASYDRGTRFSLPPGFSGIYKRHRLARFDVPSTRLYGGIAE